MAYRQHLRQRRMPPVKVELLTVNQPDQMQAAEGIQSMVAEAGFDLRIQAIEFASSLQASQRGDYELYLIGWSGRVGNVSHYSNPAVDKLLEDGRALTDVGLLGA
jgi:peptide/nickel transport system substrate-binding protein